MNYPGTGTEIFQGYPAIRNISPILFFNIAIRRYFCKKKMKNIFILLLLLPLSAIAGKAVSDTSVTPEPVKAALLIIDIQNAWLPHMANEGQALAIQITNGAIWVANQNDIPVFRIYHTDPKWGPQPGSAPFEFTDSIITAKKEHRVIKNHPNAFKKTDLDRLLKETGCNTLFICGLSSTGCALATYFGAIEHDYQVFTIRGALMGPDPALTRAVESIVNSISFDTYLFMIQTIHSRP